MVMMSCEIECETDGSKGSPGEIQTAFFLIHDGHG